MQRLRSDAEAIHRLISNTAHYATLPLAEVEKLAISLANLIGVIRRRV